MADKMDAAELEEALEWLRDMSEATNIFSSYALKLLRHIGELDYELKGAWQQIERDTAALRGFNARVAELEAAHNAAMSVVNEQAEDEGLWGESVYASEAYIQQELRRLAAAVEGPPTKWM